MKVGQQCELQLNKMKKDTVYSLTAINFIDCKGLCVSYATYVMSLLATEDRPLCLQHLTPRFAWNLQIDHTRYACGESPNRKVQGRGCSLSEDMLYKPKSLVNCFSLWKEVLFIQKAQWILKVSWNIQFCQFRFCQLKEALCFHTSVALRKAHWRTCRRGFSRFRAIFDKRILLVLFVFAKCPLWEALMSGTEMMSELVQCYGEHKVAKHLGETSERKLLLSWPSHYILAHLAQAEADSSNVQQEAGRNPFNGFQQLPWYLVFFPPGLLF